MAAETHAVELGAILAELDASVLWAGDREPEPDRTIIGAVVWVPGDDIPEDPDLALICAGLRAAADANPLLDSPTPRVLLLCGEPTEIGDLDHPRSADHLVVWVAANAGTVAGAIARATQSADESATRRLASLQRSLSLALADPAPVPALLGRLKRACNATAALMDRHGEIVHATGPVPRALLFEEISSTKADTQTLGIDGWNGLATRIAQSSVPDEHMGWLIVTSRRADFPETFTTSAVHVAASLVEASERMAVVVRQQERAVRASVLEQALALRWERHDAELAARVAGLGIDFGGEARVVVASLTKAPRAAPAAPTAEGLLDILDRILSIAGHPALLTTRDSGVTMLLQCSVGVLQRLLAARQDDLPTMLVGVGRPLTSVDGVVDSYHDAQLAIRTLRHGPEQQRLMAYEDFDFATRLFADVGLDKMVAWAEDFLRPLAGRENLVSGVRAYFEHDQNINLAAESLSIHHNSLRYRLGKVEELLSINLKQPAAVSSLFLALTAVDLTRQAGALRPRTAEAASPPAVADVDAPGTATRFEAGGSLALGVVFGPDR